MAANAAAEINLIAAGTNLSNSVISSPAVAALIRLGRDTYNWLQREGIDIGLYDRCMSLASGLAEPNENGRAIQHQIESAERSFRARIVNAPINLRLAGSLGRALANNPDTIYMVSTIASLLTCQNEESAAWALTDFILRSHQHDTKNETLSRAHRTAILAVVRKIVTSVRLNVVNAGHNGAPLPNELADLCPHTTESGTFAEVVHQVDTRTNGDIVIRSHYFMADITLWILNHFHGTIVVSVSGNVIIEQKLGAKQAKVYIYVDHHCESQLRDGHETNPRLDLIQVSLNEDAGSKMLFTGSAMYSEGPPQDARRRELYVLSPRQEKLLGFEGLNMTLAWAKRMIAWLLNLEVPYSCHSFRGEMRLDVVVQSGNDGDLLAKRPLSMFLARYPAIMNRSSNGHSSRAATARTERQLSGDKTPRKGSPSITGLVWYFPILADLAAEMAHRCSCRSCRLNQDIITCQQGCLRYVALSQVYNLIAHAICDAAGVNSIASPDVTYRDVCAEAVCHVLFELVTEEQVHWLSWFNVIATTTAGIDGEEHIRTPVNQYNFDAGTPLALQYGSCTIVWKAMALDKPLQLSSILSVKVYDAGIAGIADDIGILFAEGNVGSQGDWSEKLIAASFAQDLSGLELLTAIFPAGDLLYRQLSMVRNQDKIVVVDPGQVAENFIKSRVPRCKHVPDQQDALRRPHKIRDEVMTKTIDHSLQLNMLLGRTQAGAVIRGIDECCLNDARAARSLMSAKEMIPIINISTCLLDELQVSASGLRLTDGAIDLPIRE